MIRVPARVRAARSNRGITPFPFHSILPYHRHLADGLGSLGNPIGTPTDKIKVGLFRLKSLLGSLDDLLAAPETTILQRLKVGQMHGCLTQCVLRACLPAGWYRMNVCRLTVQVCGLLWAACTKPASCVTAWDEVNPAIHTHSPYRLSRRRALPMPLDTTSTATSGPLAALCNT